MPGSAFLLAGREFIVRILALETSSRSAAAALLEDERLVACDVLSSHAGTAAGLAPLIARLLASTGWVMSDIELIAVPVGPGSFTGLRVGVTTAKTLAYALSCEVLGLDTLEVIAAQAPDSCQEVWAVIDAQRQQLFCGRFERTGSGEWQSSEPAAILDNAAFLVSLRDGQSVTGPGLRRIRTALPPNVVVVAEDSWSPRAETVGRLALSHYRAGRRDDFWKLAPRYYRQSAAEEKAAGRK
ncbi:MAG: tRNA (adenosine(37)-N6)-threonylcarbamoyltransferase complex dimerization subunit type 1 TsaB [Pirellulaceae bacterium]